MYELNSQKKRTFIINIIETRVLSIIGFSFNLFKKVIPATRVFQKILFDFFFVRSFRYMDTIFICANNCNIYFMVKFSNCKNVKKFNGWPRNAKPHYVAQDLLKSNVLPARMISLFCVPLFPLFFRLYNHA